MTEKQLAEWKEDAAETLANIAPGKKTKENFLLAGASLAILNNHGNTAVAEPSTATQETSLSYIADELKDAEKYISVGENDIARDELRHAQHFIDKAWQSAYTQEDQVVIRDFRARHDLLAQSAGAYDVVHDSKIDEVLQELLTAFVAYTKEKIEYQSISSDTNKMKMLQKLDDMLDLQREIFSLLWRSFDTEEERERLKEWRDDICQSKEKNKIS